MPICFNVCNHILQELSRHGIYRAAVLSNAYIFTRFTQSFLFLMPCIYLYCTQTCSIPAAYQTYFAPAVLKSINLGIVSCFTCSTVHVCSCFLLQIWYNLVCDIQSFVKDLSSISNWNVIALPWCCKTRRLPFHFLNSYQIDVNQTFLLPTFGSRKISVS